MRTTSGAHVFVRDRNAIKVGTGAVGERLVEQADYLRLLGPAVSPQVGRTYKFWGVSGYTMERLHEYPSTSIAEKVGAVVSGLQNHVWNRPTTRGYVVWSKVNDYIYGRVERFAPEYEEELKCLRRCVKWDELRMCLTHGDPTLENVMVDGNGQRVLIDPLPPKIGIPELMAVDLGKILQSLYGYEQAKSGKIIVHQQPELLLDRRDISDEEKIASLYFCAVHYVRLLPYQLESERWRYRDILRTVLEDACCL